MGFLVSQTVADLLLPPPPLLFAVLIMRWEVGVSCPETFIFFNIHPNAGSLGSCRTLEIDVATGRRVSLLPGAPRLREGQEARVRRNWSHNHERSRRLGPVSLIC